MSAWKQWVIKPLKSLYRQGRAYYWQSRARDLGKIPARSQVDTMLFLLPESGIQLYINYFVTLAKGLQQQGKRVIFARCYNVFDRCIFMDSESMAIDASAKNKQDLCSYCVRSFQRHVIENGFEWVDLRHFTQAEDRLHIESVVAQHEGPFVYHHDDINISGILKYSFFLYLKKNNLEQLSAQELLLWQQHLTSLVVGYESIKRLINHLSITHIIMNDEYSLNCVIKELAKQKNIAFMNTTYPFHKDIDESRVRVMAKDSLVEQWHAIHEWKNWQSLSLPAAILTEVVDDLIIKMSTRGIYSYSPSKTITTDLIERLGLDSQRKTIVAYPSSPDEVDAILNSYKERNIELMEPRDAFNTQYEWLQALIDFVDTSTEYQLVIRMHPRMAPNHREKWGCLAASEFERFTNNQSPFVKIIWAKDPISSFDLVEIADVVSIAWSSMGIFMARMGIPVISGLRRSVPIPNEPFHVFADNPADFFAQLQELAYRPPNPQILLDAWRWYHMMTLGYSAKLTNLELIEPVFIKQQSMFELNHEQLQQQQSSALRTQELEKAKQQLYRIIHFFMTNQDVPSIAAFTIRPKSEAQIALEHCLSVDGNYLTYQYAGQGYQKHSTTIKRLVVMLQDASSHSLQRLG